MTTSLLLGVNILGLESKIMLVDIESAVLVERITTVDTGSKVVGKVVPEFDAKDSALLVALFGSYGDSRKNDR